MNNISYASRYKFLISIGILLVASPFLFVLGYMKNIEKLFEFKDFPKGFEKDTIELLNVKKDLLFIVKNKAGLFIMLAIAIIALGIYLIRIGLNRWEEYDNVDLEKLKNETKKLESENKKLEIEIEGLKKANKTLSTLSLATLEEALNNNIETVEDTSLDLVYGERLVNKLKNEDDYLFYSKFKLTENLILDALAISKLEVKKDIIYEFKYLNKIDESLVKQIIDKLQTYSKIYENLTGKTVLLKLILITNNNLFDEYKMMLKELENTDIKIELILENSLK